MPRVWASVPMPACTPASVPAVTALPGPCPVPEQALERGALIRGRGTPTPWRGLTFQWWGVADPLPSHWLGQPAPTPGGPSGEQEVGRRGARALPLLGELP